MDGVFIGLPLERKAYGLLDASKPVVLMKYLISERLHCNIFLDL